LVSSSNQFFLSKALSTISSQASGVIGTGFNSPWIYARSAHRKC
jgi:hypothetical protein